MPIVADIIGSDNPRDSFLETLALQLQKDLIIKNSHLLEQYENETGGVSKLIKSLGNCE